MSTYLKIQALSPPVFKLSGSRAWSLGQSPTVQSIPVGVQGSGPSYSCF